MFMFVLLFPHLFLEMLLQTKEPMPLLPLCPVLRPPLRCDQSATPQQGHQPHAIPDLQRLGLAWTSILIVHKCLEWQKFEMDIIYESDVWCDIATLRQDGPKKNSPQNISSEKQKQITNVKHKKQKKKRQPGGTSPTPPPKKQKHNKRSIQKKRRSKLQP